VTSVWSSAYNPAPLDTKECLPIPIDFQLPPDVEEVRLRVCKFMDTEVRPAEATLQEREADRNSYVRTIMEMRTKAKGQGLWNPAPAAEWDGNPTRQAKRPCSGGSI
jgi:alkylation response protein AidB-like acyl-CoA dehydrogenase